MDVMASWRVENSELESWVFGTNDEFTTVSGVIG